MAVQDAAGSAGAVAGHCQCAVPDAQSADADVDRGDCLAGCWAGDLLHL